MVVIPGPVTFTMGSPFSEVGRFDSEPQHRMKINRTFAIASKAVTKKQFLHFRKDHLALMVQMFAPSDECPAHRVTWYEAAAYCNWLSQQEGIPPAQWCYETDRQGKVLKLKEKFMSLTGYRLPSEPEMEYACRARAITSRYYGESEALLGKYAWYARNANDRSWPVGILKPNDFGLFDMLGNVLCWCQEKRVPYPEGKQSGVFDDIEGELDVNSLDARPLRGGSFVYQSANIRSATHFSNIPSYVFGDIGLRPARTITVE